MVLTPLEQKALASLDEAGLVQTLRGLLRIPSITGREASAQHWLAERMRELGLEVDQWVIDLTELQRHPAFPGMEVERDSQEAIGLVGTWRCSEEEGPRLIFTGISMSCQRATLLAGRARPGEPSRTQHTSTAGVPAI